MYDAISGTFKCAPIVHATIHPAHNPSIALLMQALISRTPVSLNLSLYNKRSPLPLGPFSRPIFLEYVIASGD